MGGTRNWDKGQVVKWTVYSLLFLNFGYYFFEEMYIASHTLRNGGSLFDWTTELATTIDEIGWLGLILLFELETYALSDETLKRKRVAWTIHGLRLVCYAMLAHTVAARISIVTDFEQVVQAPEITRVCQLANRDISFGSNYRYTLIDPTNCADLSGDDTFYFLEPSVVTDAAGYALERKHVWIDLNDAVVWLLVVWAIELAVWLQNRDIAGGRLMLATHAAKLLYAVLLLHAGWWIYAGHWVWGWDQFVWIAGFWAIEKNLSAWREEIREEHVAGVI